eukprot:scaffold4.g4803.t1
MRLPAPSLLLVAVCLAALALGARAQDVEVVSYFPDNPTTEFFPGQLVTAVLGVRNTGAMPVNVSYAAANLASPYNASLNIYNFTGQARRARGKRTHVDMRGGKQMVYYAVGEEQFLAKLFYNETINVIEEATWFDVQLIGLVVMGAAAALAALYSAVEYAKGKGWIKRNKKAAKAAHVSTDKSEWLPGTYHAEQRKKAGKQG